MQLVSLASGSRGNCFYANINGVNILIDVGLSMKKINENLIMNVGIDLEDINLIIITHRHDDHIQSLHTIINKYEHIKVLAPNIVFEEYLEHKKKHIPQDRRIIIDDRYKGNNINIKTIALNHDVSCYGYLFTDKSNGETFCFLADNGGLSYKKYDDIKGCTYYAIESNHDLTLEINHPNRELLTKRRSLSYYGHNNNVDAIKTLLGVMSEDTKGVIFHHLSEDCNSEELASETHENWIRIFGEVRNTNNIKRVYARQHEAVWLVNEAN